MQTDALTQCSQPVPDMISMPYESIVLPESPVMQQCSHVSVPAETTEKSIICMVYLSCFTCLTLKGCPT